MSTLRQVPAGQLGKGLGTGLGAALEKPWHDHSHRTQLSRWETAPVSPGVVLSASVVPTFEVAGSRLQCGFIKGSRWIEHGASGSPLALPMVHMKSCG